MHGHACFVTFVLQDTNVVPSLTGFQEVVTDNASISCILLVRQVKPRLEFSTFARRRWVESER